MSQNELPPIHRVYAKLKVECIEEIDSVVASTHNKITWVQQRQH